MYLVPKNLFDNYVSKSNEKCTQVVRQINNVDVNGPGPVNISSSEPNFGSISSEPAEANISPQKSSNNVSSSFPSDNPDLSVANSNQTSENLDFSRVPIATQKNYVQNAQFDPDDINTYNKPDISVLNSTIDDANQLQSTMINNESDADSDSDSLDETKEMIFVKNSDGVKIPKIVEKKNISAKWNEPSGTDIFNAAIARSKSELKDNYYNDYNKNEVEKQESLKSAKAKVPLTVNFVKDGEQEIKNLPNLKSEIKQKAKKRTKPKMSSIHYQKKPVREIQRSINLEDSYTIADDRSRKRKPVIQLKKN